MISTDYKYLNIYLKIDEDSFSVEEVQVESMNKRMRRMTGSMTDISIFQQATHQLNISSAFLFLFLFTSYLLPIASFLLPATCYLLPATCYLLPATCYLLPPTCTAEDSSSIPSTCSINQTTASALNSNI